LASSRKSISKQPSAKSWDAGEQRTLVPLTNTEALLATAVGTSPEFTGVASDASERMARVAGTLRETVGVGYA
jgi:hypothetical protein